jgi:hypothetical protein
MRRAAPVAAHVGRQRRRAANMSKFFICRGGALAYHRGCEQSEGARFINVSPTSRADALTREHAKESTEGAAQNQAERAAQGCGLRLRCRGQSHAQQRLARRPTTARHARPHVGGQHGARRRPKTGKLRPLPPPRPQAQAPAPVQPSQARGRRRVNAGGRHGDASRRHAAAAVKLWRPTRENECSAPRQQRPTARRATTCRRAEGSGARARKLDDAADTRAVLHRDACSTSDWRCSGWPARVQWVTLCSPRRGRDQQTPNAHQRRHATARGRCV